jgi:SNF2 family DNA or RNA helicase
MDDLVTCLRYNGRASPEERIKVLQKFKEGNESRVILMSRAAGGIGLEIAWANAALHCGPWWKRKWEIQGYKCAWRPGAKSILYLRILSFVGVSSRLGR